MDAGCYVSKRTKPLGGKRNGRVRQGLQVLRQAWAARARRRSAAGGRALVDGGHVRKDNAAELYALFHCCAITWPSLGHHKHCRKRK